MDAVFSNQVNAVGEGSSLLASPSFAWRGGPATSLAFAYDRRGDVAQMVRLGGEVHAVVDLVDTTAGRRTTIVPTQPVLPRAGFATTSAQVPAGVLVDGHSYRLELTTIFRNLVAAQTEATVGYDNVRLTADGAGAFDLGALGDNGLAGAGGLRACSLKAVAPPKAKTKSGSARVTLSAKQLRINQRISQAGVRRVNAIADKLTAGLTAADFRDCSIGMKEFSSQAVTGAQNGGLAIPAAGAVAAARKTPDRSARSSRPGKVTLSVKQLRINQRISQAAVLRVNAISKRMKNGLTAGDLRNGTLAAAALDTDLRRAFARGVPADGVSTAPVKLRVERKKASGGGRVTLSAKQLRINQRISQAAVRRINRLRAELAAGLTGANVKDGSLARATLAPPVQTGGR
jgi:anti-sigma28 factor (negative regulator of flagellin synthesis)